MNARKAKALRRAAERATVGEPARKLVPTTWSSRRGMHTLAHADNTTRRVYQDSKP